MTQHTLSILIYPTTAIDYAEEQNSELEVLRSIYPEEFELAQEDPPVFTIDIISDVAKTPCSVKLKVAYTTEYPDQLPDFKILLPGTTDLTSEDKDRLYNATQKIAEESLGMVMVFSMTSTLKETLDDVMTKRVQELERLDRERVERDIAREQAKFIGTKVTKERFLEWKQKFDAEMAEAERITKSKVKYEDKKNKLTGRQLFEKDATLAGSDSTYMEEGDNTLDSEIFTQKVIIEEDEPTPVS
ncbi:Protein gir2 [Dispira simplex]|nr:Protein gir2 [Dispira simplex]